MSMTWPAAGSRVCLLRGTKEIEFSKNFISDYATKYPDDATALQATLFIKCTSGTGGPFLRPRCIGTVRARIHYLINHSCSVISYVGENSTYQLGSSAQHHDTTLCCGKSWNLKDEFKVGEPKMQNVKQVATKK